MSTETYGEAHVVEPAVRAPRVGAGRKAGPNPFTTDVRAVIGQATSDGRPLTIGRSFMLNIEQGETLKQRKDRIRRFLTRAGKELAEIDGADRPYLIGLAIEAVNDNPGYVAKFWDRTRP